MFQIKKMLPIISNSAQKLAEYIGYCIEQNNQKTINIKDVSEIIFRYSLKTHILYSILLLFININDVAFYSISLS